MVKNALDSSLQAMRFVPSLFQYSALDRGTYLKKLTALVISLFAAHILFYVSIYTQSVARIEPTIFHYGLQIISSGFTLASWMIIASLSGNILVGRLDYLNRSEMWMLPIVWLAITSAPWGFLAVAILLSLDEIKGPSLDEMLEQHQAKALKS